MVSPAKAHFQRTLAAQAAAAVLASGMAPPMPTEGTAANQYQQLLIALGEDLRRLKNIQSVERKIEAKREMIRQYLPWAEGAVAGEIGAQDEIVSTMLVWTIDICEWPLALDFARHVLAHAIALPERYRRQPAVLVAEEVAEAGLRNPPAADLITLQEVAALTEKHDMPDQVRAKLAKAVGLAFKAQADAFDPEAESAPAGGKAALVDSALEHFNRALQLDKGCGVKKLIETLSAERKRLGT